MVILCACRISIILGIRNANRGKGGLLQVIGLTTFLNQSDCPGGQPRTFKLKRPEVGTWKTNQPKVQGKLAIQKPTFGKLLNKYSKVVRSDRTLKRRPR